MAPGSHRQIQAWTTQAPKGKEAGMIRNTIVSFTIIALLIYLSSEHFADSVINLIEKTTTSIIHEFNN